MRIHPKIFSCKKIDSHYKVNLLGWRMNFRRAVKINWPTIDKSGLCDAPRRTRLVASLTSIPKRMEGLPKVVSSLLSQNLKPDILVLWLAVEEFPNREKDLPQELLRLRDFGLSIKWCKNLRSYKKLVPSLLEYPDDIVATFDDDMYYAPDVLENLYNSYLANPKAAHCYRTGRIRIGEDDSIIPIHNKVLMERSYSAPSFLNVIMSGTGTLCPPRCFHEDILNEEVFMKILPTNDEIFFWAMAVRAGTRIVNVKGFDCEIHCLREAQKYSLSNVNKPGAGGIDGRSALALMAKTYPEIIPILKAEDENV